MLTGTYTALITPFKKGQLDETAFTRLVKAQVRAGVDGVVPVGTTGESPTVTSEEHIRLIEIAVKAANGRIKVMAGTGANSTSEAIHYTKAAEKLGADASLQVSPYYNKPSQEGLFQHFKAVARATSLPIVLYSIPGRCVVPIAVDTVKRLASSCKNIMAIKEAGGDADRVSQLREALPDSFVILSGDDALTLPFMSVGASGVVSVASNILPRQISKMVRAFAQGDTRAALKLHETYYPLFKALFIETNPVPIKTAMAMLGQVDEEFRLPLVKLNKSSRASLSQALKAAKVLK